MFVNLITFVVGFPRHFCLTFGGEDLLRDFELDDLILRFAVSHEHETKRSGTLSIGQCPILPRFFGISSHPLYSAKGLEDLSIFV